MDEEEEEWGMERSRALTGREMNNMMSTKKYGKKVRKASEGGEDTLWLHMHTHMHMHISLPLSSDPGGGWGVNTNTWHEATTMPSELPHLPQASFCRSSRKEEWTAAWAAHQHTQIRSRVYIGISIRYHCITEAERWEWKKYREHETGWGRNRRWDTKVKVRNIVGKLNIREGNTKRIKCKG